jgi:hypothetical protein
LPCHLAHPPLDLLSGDYGAKLAGLENLVHISGVQGLLVVAIVRPTIPLT